MCSHQGPQAGKCKISFASQKHTREQNNILCRHGRQGYSKQYIYTSFDDPFSEMYVNQNSKQGPPEVKTAEHPTGWGPKNLLVFRYTDYRIHRKAYRTFRLLSSHKLLVNPCVPMHASCAGRKWQQTPTPHATWHAYPWQSLGTMAE